MLSICMMYMLFLSVWTVIAIPIEAFTYVAIYIAATLLLHCLTWVVDCLHFQKKTKIGLWIAFVFSSLGLSIAYRMGQESLTEYLKDLMLMIFAFTVIYLIIRYTVVYRMKILNVLCMVCLPVILIMARLFFEPVGGAYIYFFGILIFGVILMGFPFVTAYFMSLPEDTYRDGSVRNLSKNMMGMLLYMFLLYAGCALCYEFGLLMVLALTSTVLFFIRCKNGVTKCFYCLLCGLGALAASIKIPHIHDRMVIWLDPASAYADSHLAGKAESVLYLFRNFKRMGWWGNGIGHLPESIYPTLNTDHILVTLMNDYSIFIAIFVLILGVLFVKWMLIESPELCVYDHYLNLSSALIVGFIILIHVASNLGSFITAGVGFPWISDGGSVNLMLTVLMAIHCAILERKVKTDVTHEEFL